MTIDTSYQDQFPFLFAGNAEEISILYLTQNSRVDVSISVYFALSNVSHTFSLLATGNRVVIPLKDILCALPLPDEMSQSLVYIGGLVKLEIQAGQESKSWQSYVIFGARIPRSQILPVYNGKQFISIRPQKYIIDGNTEERICAVLKESSNARLEATIFSDILSPLRLQLNSNQTWDLIGIMSQRISLSMMEKLASDAGFPSLNILGFDINVVFELEAGKEERGETLRYFVHRGKAEIFQFYGNFGVLETIYATGNRKTELTTEPTSFTNGGIECELTNDSHLIHETFTGWLESKEEVRFWQEFFSSARRYAVIDGVSRRIIIDEVDSESTEGEINAFSFKWHYADKHDDPSMVPIRKELKQYKI